MDNTFFPAKARADAAFLNAQNAYYLELMRNLEEELQSLISDLDRQIN